MMLTGSGDEQQAQPMNIVQIDERGTIWFISSLSTERSRQLEQAPQVRLLCHSTSVFLSLAGRAEVVRDHAKFSELWREPFKVWFPDGRRAKDAAVISVSPIAGEYWDQSGTKSLTYRFEPLKAREQAPIQAFGPVN